MSIEAIGISIAIMIFSYAYLSVKIQGDNWGVLRLFFLAISLIMSVFEFGVLGEIARDTAGYENLGKLMNVGLTGSWFVFYIVMILVIVMFIYRILDMLGKLPQRR